MNSVGAYFRASVRRELALPPVWIGRARRGVTETVTLEHAGALLVLPDPVQIQETSQGVETILPSVSAIGREERRSSEERGVTAGETALELPAASGTDGWPSAAGPGGAIRRQSVVPLGAERERPGADVTAGETATKRQPVTKPVAPARPRGQRIDLAAAPSEMDRIFNQSRAVELAEVEQQHRAEGVVACRCGARGAGEALGMVPAWFGRDCIERDCPLKPAAAAKAQVAA